MKNLLMLGLLASLFAPAAKATELTTTFVGGNGQNGNMFDLVTKGKSLNVTGLDLNLVEGAFTIEVYTKSGTWVGSDKNRSAWTLIDSALVTSVGGATFFDISDFNLAAFGTTGLYITATSPIDTIALNYTNGTAVGQVAVENTDLAILEGAGKQYAFGDTYEPRIWNGTIIYDTVANVVPEPCSLALFGLGLAGLSLLSRRKQS